LFRFPLNSYQHGPLASGGKHGTEIPHICLRDFSCRWDGPRNHNLGGFPKTSERLGRDSEGDELPAESLEGVLKAGSPPKDSSQAGARVHSVTSGAPSLPSDSNGTAVQAARSTRQPQIAGAPRGPRSQRSPRGPVAPSLPSLPAAASSCQPLAGTVWRGSAIITRRARPIFDRLRNHLKEPVVARMLPAAEVLPKLIIPHHWPLVHMSISDTLSG
jgi:hypothetical protein